MHIPPADAVRRQFARLREHEVVDPLPTGIMPGTYIDQGGGTRRGRFLNHFTDEGWGNRYQLQAPEPFPTDTAGDPIGPRVDRALRGPLWSRPDHSDPNDDTILHELVHETFDLYDPATNFDVGDQVPEAHLQMMDDDGKTSLVHDRFLQVSAVISATEDSSRPEDATCTATDALNGWLTANHQNGVTFNTEAEALQGVRDAVQAVEAGLFAANAPTPHRAPDLNQRLGMTVVIRFPYGDGTWGLAYKHLSDRTALYGTDPDAPLSVNTSVYEGDEQRVTKEVIAPTPASRASGQVINLTQPEYTNHPNTAHHPRLGRFRDRVKWEIGSRIRETFHAHSDGYISSDPHHALDINSGQAYVIRKIHPKARFMITNDAIQIGWKDGEQTHSERERDMIDTGTLAEGSQAFMNSARRPDAAIIALGFGDRPTVNMTRPVSLVKRPRPATAPTPPVTPLVRRGLLYNLLRPQTEADKRRQRLLLAGIGAIAAGVVISRVPPARRQAAVEAAKQASERVSTATVARVGAASVAAREKVKLVKDTVKESTGDLTETVSTTAREKAKKAREAARAASVQAAARGAVRARQARAYARTVRDNRRQAKNQK